MTDPFRDDGASVELGQRREFYDIFQSELVTYRIASGIRDIVYDGNTYKASPIARTDVLVSTTSGTFEMSISLPLNHPMVQRYLAMGSPPQRIDVVVWQKQLNSGLVESIWRGVVTSMAIEDRVAKFLIPSPLGRALDRMVPSLTVGLPCPHILYDPQCRKDPADFSVTTTVVSFNGRTIRLATVGAFGDENFAFGGDIRHVPTGEIQPIFSENGIEFDGTTTFEMQAPLVELAVGDEVVVRAGCAHDVAACHDKFDNIANYGGMPERHTANPFTLGGVGFVPG